jgi:O-antigen/teichoic acid export membrane protein
MERRPSIELAVDAMRDGRWVLPANLLGSVIMQALVWTLALAQSPAGAANLQAVVNVVGVANPVMFGVANLIMPLMARERQSSRPGSTHRRSGLIIAQGGVLLLPYSLVLWIWPGRILELIYGRSSPYVALATPLRLLAVAYLLVYVVHVGNAALFGYERPQAVLAVQLAGVVALAVCGVPLTLIWGVTGAAVATIVVHAVRAAVCGRGAREIFRMGDHPLVSLGETA